MTNNRHREDITAEAETLSTTYMAMIQNIAPRNAVYLLNHLKDGLKFGADEISNKKHAIFMIMNVIKKVIVMNVAILFTSENKHI